MIAGAIIGFIGSIGTAVWIEWLRRPHLELSVEQPPLEINYMANMPAQNARALRVRLSNRPLHPWVRWMARGPALVHDVLPILEQRLSDDLDGHAASRLKAMRERYSSYIERERRRGPPGADRSVRGLPDRGA